MQNLHAFVVYLATIVIFYTIIAVPITDQHVINIAQKLSVNVLEPGLP